MKTSCSIAYVMTNHSTSDDVPIIRLCLPSTTDQLGNRIRGGIYFELLKPHRHLSLKMNFSLPVTMAVAGPSVVTEFIAPPNTCLDCYTTYGEFCVIYCGNFQQNYILPHPKVRIDNYLVVFTFMGKSSRLA